MVLLTCMESISEEVVSYQWYKNQVKLQDKFDKELNIGNTREGTGKYTCDVVTAKAPSMKSDDKEILFICK